MSSPQGPTVALFATCVNDTMFPQTPMAVVTVLERLGCRVVFPSSQTCCGQMTANTGYLKQSVGTVRNYVDSFENFDYIVGPSGSCVGAVRHQHPMIARSVGDEGLARAAEQTAGHTYEFSEFLVDVLQVTDVGAYFPHTVTYHPTCHSVRIAHVGDKPMQLLRAVEGITINELTGADQCCGFGGTFSVKNADVSVAMGADKARHVIDSGAEYLVAGDNSCLMHIGGLLHREREAVQTIHLAEILAQTKPASTKGAR